MPEKQRVILDTDMGTDVDDCLALALVLSSPEISLDGVTCVHGDATLRARMVLKLLQLYGQPSVPVTVGATEPLLGLRPVFWAGHEGEGLLEPGDEDLAPDVEHAVDFIVRTVLGNPGRVHLVAIGPLTNVALAFLKEPRLPDRLAHLTIMGGAVRGLSDLVLPYVEHNVACDPEAAHVVFSAGAPTTLVPLDVTSKVEITPQGVDRIRSGGTAFHEAVARQVELYPRFADAGRTALHDPLAVGALLAPDLLDTQSLHVDVELAGQHTAGATLVRTPDAGERTATQVALRVRAEAFEELFLGRLESARPSPIPRST